MKPIYTHLLAAIGGATLVFLLTSSPPTPDKNSPTQKSTRSSARSLQIQNTKAPAWSPDENQNGIDFLNTLLGESPTPEQIEAFLDANNRNVDSLIGACLILNDLKYIREGLKLEPDNPHLLCIATSRSDGTPKERLAWAKRLSELQPNNAYSSYLLTSQLITSGDTDAALDSMRKSLDQPDLSAFTAKSMLLMEEAYLGTGRTKSQAAASSSFGLPMPSIFEMSKVSKELQQHASTLSDPIAHTELRSMIASMGSRISEEMPTQLLITDLVGLSVQQRALVGLPDDSPSPFEGYTVAEARSMLEQRRTDLEPGVLQAEDYTHLVAHPNAEDVMTAFTKRVKIIGEYDATIWLKQQLEPQP